MICSSWHVVISSRMWSSMIRLEFYGDASISRLRSLCGLLKKTWIAHYKQRVTVLVPIKEVGVRSLLLSVQYYISDKVSYLLSFTDSFKSLLCHLVGFLSKTIRFSRKKYNSNANYGTHYQWVYIQEKECFTMSSEWEYSSCGEKTHRINCR